MGDGLVITYCHGGTIDGPFHDSLIATIQYDATHSQRILRRGGVIGAASSPRIAPTRNMLVRQFLDLEVAGKKPDWLLMVDTDMVFKPLDVERLFAHCDPVNTPIVGGLCFGGGMGPKMTPTLYIFHYDDDGKLVTRNVFDYPRDTMVEVDATGAAFFICHRSVYEAMYEKLSATTVYPWFAETEQDGKEVGEDVCFFARARKLGFKVHVHTGVKIGHLKSKIMDEAMYDEYNARVAVDGEAKIDADYEAKLPVRVAVME